MIHNYDWSSIKAGAVLESDRHKLSERILEAEIGDFAAHTRAGLTRREWQVMEIAMDILRDMRMRRHSPLYERRHSNSTTPS
jgi:hypothetical protein